MFAQIMLCALGTPPPCQIIIIIIIRLVKMREIQTQNRTQQRSSSARSITDGGNASEK